MPGAVLPQNPKLVAVADVDIDENASFKYILCIVTDPDKQGDKKIIVRGTAGVEYHADIYDELDSILEEQGLTCQCIGGGKINHNAQEKKIDIFGKSQGYGKANHAETADLLKVKYPDYTITWRNE